jgi:hypothetical protein
MLNKFLRFSFILYLTTNAIISGCSVNEDSPNIEIDPRLVFIDGKTDLEIKEGFSNLDFEGQKEIWISKLKQVLKTSIGQDQKEYINILISEFEKSNKIQDLKSKRIQVIAIEIAKITPKEDLHSMFTNLRNFEPSNFSAPEICNECLDSLIEDWDSDNEIFETNARIMAKCNCKWTCGVCFCSMDIKITSDCTATSSGCGFLWLQSCEKRDYI